MTLLTCAAVRRRLPTFHDDELPIADTIAVETHVKDCARCAQELSGLRDIRDALRLAAAPGPADDWTGLQPGVMSRMKAEEQESWTARAGRLLDDLHLVWIGLAATTATFLCGALVLGMLHYASPERDDSLAAVIAVVAAPYGTELNPIRSFGSYISVPTVPAKGAMADTREATSLTFPCTTTIPTGRRPRSSSTASRAPGSSRRASASRRWPSTSYGCSRTRRCAGSFRGRRSALSPGTLALWHFDKDHRFTSATAVATLFMASVARMMTLRAFSAASSAIANSSRRESGIPSFG